MNALFRAVAALVAVVTATLFLATAAGAEPASAEGDFLARINQLRAENGVAPLAHDGQMTDVARRWSGEMARRNELSHNPNLKSEVQNWRIVGENVGVGSNVAMLQRAFEESPRHRENMLNAKYTHAGIGVVEANGRMWVTEVFKQARTAPAPAAPIAPAPPKPAAAPRVRVTAPPRPRPAPVRAAAPVVRVTAPVTAPTTTAAPAPVAAPVVQDAAGDQVATAPAAAGSNARAAGMAGVLAAALLGAVISAARRPVFALRSAA